MTLSDFIVLVFVGWLVLALVITVVHGRAVGEPHVFRCDQCGRACDIRVCVVEHRDDPLPTHLALCAACAAARRRDAA